MHSLIKPTGILCCHLMFNLLTCCDNCGGGGGITGGGYKNDG